MICDNCAQRFHLKSPRQRFCKRFCHMQYNGRQANRGRILIEHAMLWRLSRNGRFLTEMSRLIDMWLAEDEKRLGKAQQARRVREARVRRDEGRPSLIDS